MNKNYEKNEYRSPLPGEYWVQFIEQLELPCEWYFLGSGRRPKGISDALLEQQWEEIVELRKPGRPKKKPNEAA